MPRWLEIILRSIVAGGAAGGCAAVVNLTGGPSVLISLAAILIVFGISGDFRQG
ncbi:hypothetical protein [Mesorhizobium sp.]|uniref:hypothetical protein n=1 Tax=Mesorhizobium sp. TaxID=1871066 RepID=UPI0025CE5E5B|nr:hypothetical protein [Mesorhizobium sp.]